MGDLHLSDERSDGHVVVAVIYQSHFALKITDILFKTHSGLHLDGNEVNAILS